MKQLINKQKKLTVVTVCFNLVKANRIESFKTCLESVHNQTYPNIEHLIVDGASTDGTLDLIKEYSNKRWINYISEPDKGIYDAMTKGARKAKGEYIYFLNTDDFFHDNKVVADVMEIFSKKKVDAVFGDIQAYLLDRTANYIETLKLNAPTSFEECKTPDKILERNIHHQTMFYAKKLFNKCSFFCDELPSGSDWLFNTMAFIKNKHPYAYIKRTITNFNLGGVSTNKDLDPIRHCQRIQRILKEKYSKCLSPTISEESPCNNGTIKVKFWGITVFKKKSNKKINKYYFLGIPLLYCTIN